MSAKNQVISEIVALAKEHHITIDDLTSALGKQQIDGNKKDAFTLTQMFSYLGGLLILSGLVTYTAMSWMHMNSFSRILITLGPGTACIIIASLAILQGKKEKNSFVLIILSALFQSTGLAVSAAEFSTGSDNILLAAVLISGVLALQYGMLFSKLKRTSLLFFAIYFAVLSFTSMAYDVGIPGNLIEFICGVSFIAISYGIQRTPYNSICGFGYFVGSIVLLCMSFDLLEDTPVELLYLGIASFMLYISTIVNSRAILFTSAIAIFSYICNFTDEHFANVVGWPISLILLGLIFFGLSNFALKLNKNLAAK